MLAHIVESEVKSHLADTRAAIAKHLERAKAIQSKTKGEAISSVDEE